MEHNTIFRLVYTFFLGLVIAILFGVGIQAFYEAPKYPESPDSELMYKTSPSETEHATSDEDQRKYFNEMKEYGIAHKKYEQNVSIILLVLAVVTVAIAFVFSSKIKFLSDGILLGGLFTIIHGLVRGSGADNTKYLFVAACISLVVVLYLGYKRFLSEDKKKPTRKR